MTLQPTLLIAGTFTASLLTMFHVPAVELFGGHDIIAGAVASGAADLLQDVAPVVNDLVLNIAPSANNVVYHNINIAHELALVQHQLCFLEETFVDLARARSLGVQDVWAYVNMVGPQRVARARRAY